MAGAAIQENSEMVDHARRRQPRLFAHWAWMTELPPGYG
jgi:hypothetical protein